MFDLVSIHALLLDPLTERPILILRSEENGRILPIWIGASEANAIALEIERVHVPRPMTHDLLCSILDTVGVPVLRVHITDLRDNTFFAEIVLDGKGGEVPIDARPSDAVAVALRTGSPIFVKDDVFELFAASECGEEPCAERVQKWLDGLAPEELGQYKM